MRPCLSPSNSWRLPASPQMQACARIQPPSRATFGMGRRTGSEIMVLDPVSRDVCVPMRRALSRDSIGLYGLPSTAPPSPLVQTRAPPRATSRDAAAAIASTQAACRSRSREVSMPSVTRSVSMQAPELRTSAVPPSPRATVTRSLSRDSASDTAKRRHVRNIHEAPPDDCGAAGEAHMRPLAYAASRTLNYATSERAPRVRSDSGAPGPPPSLSLAGESVHDRLMEAVSMLPLADFPPAFRKEPRTNPQADCIFWRPPPEARKVCEAAQAQALIPGPGLLTPPQNPARNGRGILAAPPAPCPGPGMTPQRARPQCRLVLPPRPQQ